MTPNAVSGSQTPLPDGMKTLAALRDEAIDDSRKSKVLLILHPSNRPHNARFIDPFLGVLTFDALPGQAVYVRDLCPHETIGLFVD